MSVPSLATPEPHSCSVKCLYRCCAKLEVWNIKVIKLSMTIFSFCSVHFMQHLCCQMVLQKLRSNCCPQSPFVCFFQAINASFWKWDQLCQDVSWHGWSASLASTDNAVALVLQAQPPAAPMASGAWCCRTMVSGTVPQLEASVCKQGNHYGSGCSSLLCTRLLGACQQVGDPRLACLQVRDSQGGSEGW